jgi:nucleotide-binding universal stress UspA family protein
MTIAPLNAATKIKNVLVATDFSEPSRMALKYAEHIAGKTHASIHVAHVLPLPLPEVELSAWTVEDQRKDAQKQLDTWTGNIAAPTVAHVLQGDIWTELKRLIRRQQIDLVVTGTTASQGLKRLILGSVAESILRCADCPVLCVGPCVRVKPEFAVRRVLCPVSFDPDSVEVVPYAINIAQQTDAAVTLLHVATDAQIKTEKDKQQLRQQLTEVLEREVGDIDSHRVEYAIEFGHSASETIVQVAADLDVNLIIMGVHPRAPWASHLPDAAQRIAACAICPVLTIRSGRRSFAHHPLGQESEEITVAR